MNRRDRRKDTFGTYCSGILVTGGSLETSSLCKVGVLSVSGAGGKSVELLWHERVIHKERKTKSLRFFRHLHWSVMRVEKVYTAEEQSGLAYIAKTSCNECDECGTYGHEIFYFGTLTVFWSWGFIWSGGSTYMNDRDFVHRHVLAISTRLRDFFLLSELLQYQFQYVLNCIQLRD